MNKTRTPKRKHRIAAAAVAQAPWSAPLALASTASNGTLSPPRRRNRSSRLRPSTAASPPQPSTQKNRTPATHARTVAPVPHVNSTAAAAVAATRRITVAGKNERGAVHFVPPPTTTGTHSQKTSTHGGPLRRSLSLSLTALSLALLARAPPRRTTAAAAATYKRQRARVRSLATRTHTHTHTRSRARTHADERFSARRWSHKPLERSVSHVLRIRSVVVRSRPHVIPTLCTPHTPPDIY